VKATAWADQKAAAIRQNRGGIATAGAPVDAATILTDRFPELTPQQIGAVLMATGQIMSDTWDLLDAAGNSDEDMAALLCCLVDTTGEYLYAPEGGVS
jgi:hypothetical protein